MYIKYRNLIVSFIGNDDFASWLKGKEVLGKGHLEILNNWCGDVDHVLEYIEKDADDIRYYKDKIVLEGNLDNIKRTTVVQAIIFMLYQRKNYLSGIISLHASAVVKGDVLVIFIGSKGSGKTSMSYLLSKKYEDIMLVANDYIELKFGKDNIYTVINSDYNSMITFRSHVLYNLDRKLYVNLTGSEELIFNQSIKTTVDFVDLEKDTLVCKKIKLIFIGLGKSADFEISHKDGKSLEIELYKELVQYVRGKIVAPIEEGKEIASFYIDSAYFYDEKISNIVFEIIKQIELSNDIEVEWIRGDGHSIEEYIVNKLGCREMEYE